MRVFRLVGVTVVLLAVLTESTLAGKLDDIYDDKDLAALQPRYERGWRGNYDSVMMPVFTGEEKARFANVRFRVERRVPDHEPFGFMAGGNEIVASTASIKFLEDIALAYTWLDMSGLATQSVGDYLMMLRYWDPRRGRPPKPLEALCIPPESSMDAKIVERATRVFDVATVFVLLHEYGHALHRHPGNAAVAPAESRLNEQAADRFALEIFTRLKEPPIGVTVLFFMMSYLHENRSDYRSDDIYRATLAARTHPLSPDRLQAFARNLNAQAEIYGKAFLRGAQLSVLRLSLEVTQFAYLLSDPDIQRLSARIGRTVRPIDLAPRPKGRHLSAPCNSRAASGSPFDGTFRGKFLAGSTDFDLDVALERNGEQVSGTFSYGAGFGDMEGKVTGDRLSYRWSLGADKGAGIMTMQGAAYRGTWGNGNSASDGGTFDLKKEP
jgi:hypothetical protein